LKTAFRALTLLLCFSLTASSLLHAQAIPAASKPFALSAFGGATGTFTGLGTGLGGGKNLGITAGGDITFKPYHRYYFSGEIRGTYPVDNGNVDSQKNVLFGVKVERYFNNFRPYVDFLYGRDKIVYENGGFPNPAGTLLYLDSVSNVFSGGGGLDFTLTEHFALKIDGQFQHIGTPVTTSGAIYSKPLTIGVVYRFGAAPLAP
jgi:Outer membrane protein beta-barrel domain